MKKNRLLTIAASGLAVIVAAVAGDHFLAKRQAAHEPLLSKSGSVETRIQLNQVTEPPSAPAEESPAEETTTSSGVHQPAGSAPRAVRPSATANRPTSANRQPSAAPLPGPSQPNPSNGPADPIARVALSFVGADPEAEAYWADAINDPSLSAHERQDLIEDLNEDGFDDPKHPTIDDLPLIINRLEIIDAFAPDAMDDVNSAAFQEARKDLVEMALRAQQQ